MSDDMVPFEFEVPDNYVRDIGEAGLQQLLALIDTGVVRTYHDPIRDITRYEGHAPLHVLAALGLR